MCERETHPRLVAPINPHVPLWLSCCTIHVYATPAPPKCHAGPRHGAMATKQRILSYLPNAPVSQATGHSSLMLVAL